MKYGYLKLLIFKNEKTTLVNKILFSYFFNNIQYKWKKFKY